MNFKISSSLIQNKSIKDLENSSNEYPTLDDLMREQTLNALKLVDVFIITVGLSEVWYNKVNGQVFWKAIPSSEFDSKKHGFRVSTVEENTKNLENIYGVIKKYLPKAKIIFTLSPIPLVATFRNQSCMTANSISKSILRVSLDNVFTKYHKNEDIFYFPSYEIVNQYFIDPSGSLFNNNCSSDNNYLGLVRERDRIVRYDLSLNPISEPNVVPYDNKYYKNRLNNVKLHSGVYFNN